MLKKVRDDNRPLRNTNTDSKGAITFMATQHERFEQTITVQVFRLQDIYVIF